MKLYFKHSTRCPISAYAKMEVDGFLKEKPDDVDFELIDVIADRDRSNQLEQDLGVRHESPQAILTSDDGAVLWHNSHRRVNKQNILDAIAANR